MVITRLYDVLGSDEFLEVGDCVSFGLGDRMGQMPPMPIYNYYYLIQISGQEFQVFGFVKCVKGDYGINRSVTYETVNYV